MDLVSTIRRHPIYVRHLFGIRQRILEWVWRRHGKPPILPAPHTVKQRAVRDHARRHGLRTLVETGTYLGNMVHAVRRDFERIVSIELDPGLHERAVDLFRHEPHVSIRRGDSGELLPDIVAGLSEPALFWLDGHYAGPGTARGETESPILDELDAIMSSPHEHVVLIDDARLFLLEHEDYPPLRAVQDRIIERWPDYLLRVEDDVIRVLRHDRGTGQSPRATVQVNGASTTVELRQGQAANVTFGLDAGNGHRQPSRWWVWLCGPQGDWWFTRKGWVASEEPVSVGRFRLHDLSPILLWGRNRTFDVPGTYIFSFLVCPDGERPLAPLHSGHACVRVGSDGAGAAGGPPSDDPAFRERMARLFPAGAAGGSDS